MSQASPAWPTYPMAYIADLESRCDDLCHDLYKLSGMRVRERLKGMRQPWQRMTQPAAAASQCVPLTLMRECALFKLARNSASLLKYVVSYLASRAVDTCQLTH